MSPTEDVDAAVHVAAGTSSPERHPLWNMVFFAGGLMLAVHVARVGEPARFVAAALLALVPFTAIVLLTWVVQAHTRRPRSARRWAFLWGALVATGTSSYANGLLGSRPDWQAVVVFAPVIEETAKIVGLLLLLRMDRVRNLLDAVIYALLLGGGFSLVENTFYFFNAINAELAGDDGVLRDVFVMRALVSPLAHPLFIGAAAFSMGRYRGKRVGLVALAALAGILAHAGWNHAAVTGLLGDLIWHNVALTLAVTAGVLLLATRERRQGSSEPQGVAYREEVSRPPDPERGRAAHWSDSSPWYRTAAASDTHTGLLPETDLLPERPS